MDAPKPQLNFVVGDYVTKRTQVQMIGAAQSILGAAPDRCVLLIGNGGGLGSTVIDVVPPGGSDRGISLSNQQPTFLINSHDHPGIIWSEWFCWGPNTNFLVIVEVFYRPRG